MGGPLQETVSKRRAEQPSLEFTEENSKGLAAQSRRKKRGLVN